MKRTRRTGRRFRFETLENRILLAADPFGTNLLQPRDVNRSGEVSPLDVLQVINALQRGSGSADLAGSVGRFIDVDGSGTVAPIDALIVINTINLDRTILIAQPIHDAGLTAQESSQNILPLNGTAFDLHTNDYGIRLHVQGGSFDPLLDTVTLSDGRTTIDITGEFDGRMAELTADRIDELFGYRQPEGDFTFTLELTLFNELTRISEVISTVEVPFTRETAPLELAVAEAEPTGDGNGFQVRFLFNKPVRTDLVSLATVTIPDAGQHSNPTEVSFSDIANEISFQFSGVIPDPSAFQIDWMDFADLLGQQVESSANPTVTVYNAVWNEPSGGLWESSVNWVGGRVPQAGDTIKIRTDENAVVDFGWGNEREMPFKHLSLEGNLQLRNPWVPQAEPPMSVETIVIRRGEFGIAGRLFDATVLDARPGASPDSQGRLSSSLVPAVRIRSGSIENVQFDADVIIEGTESSTGLLGNSLEVIGKSTMNRRLILQGDQNNDARLFLQENSGGEVGSLAGRGRIELSTANLQVPNDPTAETEAVNFIQARFSDSGAIDSVIPMIGGAGQITSVQYAGRLDVDDNFDMRFFNADLNGETMFVSAARPVSVAGIRNGRVSAVTPSTKLLLETGELSSVAFDIDVAAKPAAGESIRLDVTDGVLIERDFLLDAELGNVSMYASGEIGLQGRLTLAGSPVASTLVSFTEQGGAITGSGEIDFSGQYSPAQPFQNQFFVDATATLRIDPEVRINASVGSLRSSQNDTVNIQYGGTLVAESGGQFEIGNLDTGGSELQIDGEVEVVSALGQVAIRGVDNDALVKMTSGYQRIDSADLDIRAIYDPSDPDIAGAVQVANSLQIDRAFSIRARRNEQRLVLTDGAVLAGGGTLEIDGEPGLVIEGTNAHLASGLRIAGDRLFINESDVTIESTLRPEPNSVFHLESISNEGGTIPLDFSRGGDFVFSGSLRDVRIADASQPFDVADPTTGNSPERVRIGVRSRGNVPAFTSLDRVTLDVNSSSEAFEGTDITLNGRLEMAELPVRDEDISFSAPLPYLTVAGDWHGVGKLELADGYFVRADAFRSRTIFHENLSVTVAGEGGFEGLDGGNARLHTPAPYLKLLSQVEVLEGGTVTYSGIDNEGAVLELADDSVRLGIIQNAVVELPSPGTLTTQPVFTNMDRTVFDPPILSGVVFGSSVNSIDMQSDVLIQGDVFIEGNLDVAGIVVDAGSLRAANVTIDSARTVHGVGIGPGQVRIYGELSVSSISADSISSTGGRIAAEQLETPLLSTRVRDDGSPAIPVELKTGEGIIEQLTAETDLILSGALEIARLDAENISGDANVTIFANSVTDAYFRAANVGDSINAVLRFGVASLSTWLALSTDAFDGTVYLEKDDLLSDTNNDQIQFVMVGVDAGNVRNDRLCPDRDNHGDGTFIARCLAAGNASPEPQDVGDIGNDSSSRVFVSDPTILTVLGRGMEAGSTNNSIEIVVDIPGPENFFGIDSELTDGLLAIQSSSGYDLFEPGEAEIGASVDGEKFARDLTFDGLVLSVDVDTLSYGENIIKVENIPARDNWTIDDLRVRVSYKNTYRLVNDLIPFFDLRGSQTFETSLVTTRKKADIAGRRFSDGHGNDSLEFSGETAIADFAKKFKPLFYFESNELGAESFFPTSIDSTLKLVDTIANDSNGQPLEHLPDGTSPIDRYSANQVDAALVALLAEDNSALDLIGETPIETRAAITRTEPTVYFQVVHDNPGEADERFALTYWIHYTYSNWAQYGGTNNHEGDWESITIFFENESDVYTPKEVAYSQHAKFLGFGEPGDRVSWEFATTDKTDLSSPSAGGTHPTVYVGLGGHASYPAPGVTSWPGVPAPKEEYHRGRHQAPFATNFTYALQAFPEVAEAAGNTDFVHNPSPVHQVFPNATMGSSWALYPGLWGAMSSKLGGSGPRGPVFYGDHRFHDPWQWSETLRQDTHVVVSDVAFDARSFDSNHSGESPSIDLLVYYPNAEDGGELETRNTRLKIGAGPTDELFFSRAVATYRPLASGVEPIPVRNALGIGISGDFRMEDLAAGVYSISISDFAYVRWFPGEPRDERQLSAQFFVYGFGIIFPDSEQTFSVEIR